MQDTQLVVSEPRAHKGKTAKYIDQQTFENLCRIMCTVDEVCSVLMVDRRQLTIWAKKVYGKKLELAMADFQADGKASFRRLGLRLAEQGSAPVWIFLAKNWLGMSDNPAPQTTGEESRDFAKAISSASKALARTDISSIAQIPDGGNSDA